MDKLVRTDHQPIFRLHDLANHIMNNASPGAFHGLMTRRRRSWPKFVILLLLGAGLYFGVRYLEQRTIYSPDPVVTDTPAKIRLPFQNAVVDSGNGLKLHGWFVPAEATDRPHPTLLFFHGNAGNVSYNLDRLRLFHDAGLDVLIVDYRGYGKSEGTPNERDLELDALATYFYLTEKLRVPPERLFFYGESLGAAIAIDLATQVRAAGMIIEAPFTSNADRMKKKWPGFPWESLLRDNYDSLSKIGKIGMPLLIIHSADDEIIPFGYSVRLLRVAHDPKELLQLHGPHRESFINSFDTYSDKISSFVEQYTGKPQAASASNATERALTPAGQTP
jgi:fermentation-respiration switch protein FrsA (DUF1100 family)